MTESFPSAKLLKAQYDRFHDVSERLRRSTNWTHSLKVRALLYTPRTRKATIDFIWNVHDTYWGTGVVRDSHVLLACGRLWHPCTVWQTEWSIVSSFTTCVQANCCHLNSGGNAAFVYSLTQRGNLCDDFVGCRRTDIKATLVTILPTAASCTDHVTILLTTILLSRYSKLYFIFFLTTDYNFDAKTSHIKILQITDSYSDVKLFLSRFYWLNASWLNAPILAKNYSNHDIIDYGLLHWRQSYSCHDIIDYRLLHWRQSYPCHDIIDYGLLHWRQSYPCYDVIDHRLLHWRQSYPCHDVIDYRLLHWRQATLVTVLLTTDFYTDVKGTLVTERLTIQIFHRAIDYTDFYIDVKILLLQCYWLQTPTLTLKLLAWFFPFFTADSYIDVKTTVVPNLLTTDSYIDVKTTVVPNLLTTDSYINIENTLVTSILTTDSYNDIKTCHDSIDYKLLKWHQNFSCRDVVGYSTKTPLVTM